MGVFSNMSGVKTNQGGVYFMDGQHRVQIEEIKLTVSRKKEDLFIIKGKVLATTNENQTVGTSPSQVINFKHDSALGNIKQFAGAALGITDPDAYVPEDGQDPDEFWEQTMEYFVSKEQPLKDQELNVTCNVVKTRAGTDFTKHYWSPAA